MNRREENRLTDGRDSGLHHLLRVDPGVGVDGLALDVEEVLGHDRGPLVDGLAGPVEDAAHHVLGHGRAEDVARELAGRLLGVDAVGALEHLDHGLGAGHLQDLGKSNV